MGLTSAIAGYAAGRAHVLVVEVPGSWTARVSVERQVRAHGWQLAAAPAEADILAVCGEPGAEMSAVVDTVWEQLPGPRAWTRVDRPDGAAESLSLAAARLTDVQWQREDARTRASSPTGIERPGNEPGTDHEGHDAHGDMAPAGIPLAQGGEDRDGLEMDQLHFRLGPILAHWPAGLVLRCTVQGDVVVASEPSVLDQRPHSPDHDHRRAAAPALAEYAARRCDAVLDVLALAGWDSAAARARRIRDLLLEDTDHGTAADQLRLLRRAVAGSRTLRWSLRGQGVLDAGELAERGLPARLQGDARQRLLEIVDQAVQAVQARADGAVAERARPGNVVANLPWIVNGLDLASARLVIASLDIGRRSAATESADAWSLP